MNEYKKISAKNLTVFTEPFCFFEIDDFFSPETHEQLSREWPSIDHLTTRPNAQKFTQVLSTRPTWQSSVEYFRSYRFISQIQKIIRSYVWSGHGEQVKKKWIVPSQGYGDHPFIRRLSLFAFRLFPKLRDYFFFEIKVSLSFTTMQNGDEIDVHNDEEKKLFSAMLYFPPDTWQQNYGGGTRYYKPIDKTTSEKWLEIGKNHNHLDGGLEEAFMKKWSIFTKTSTRQIN